MFVHKSDEADQKVASFCWNLAWKTHSKKQASKKRFSSINYLGIYLEQHQTRDRIATQTNFVGGSTHGKLSSLELE
jgi:hypothetical protein